MPLLFLALAGCAPCTPILEIGDGDLLADGQSTVSVTATRAGSCKGDWTVDSTLGTLASPEAPTPWQSVFQLVAGNVPGTGVVSLSAGGRTATEEIRIISPGPIGAQLHLHGPISEGDGTHRWQTAEAEAWGLDVLWWTDHDYRYWHDWYRTPEWSPGEVLATESTNPGGRESWWETAQDEDVTFAAELRDDKLIDDEPVLGLSAASEATDPALRFSSIQWRTTQRRLYRPLLSDVTIRFEVRVPEGFVSKDHAVRIEVPLSRVDPGTVRSLWFVDSDDQASLPSGAFILEVDWVPGEWVTVEHDLSDYADEILPEGLDLTLRGFVVHVGVGGGDATDVEIGGIHIDEVLSGTPLLDAQRELLTNRYSDRVQHYIGQELSYETTARLHLNALGSGVEWVDYDIRDLQAQTGEVVRDVQQQGGVVIFDHPFGITLGLSDVDDPSSLVGAACDQLSAVSVYGADAIEVGYVAREVGLDAHLDLWDCLLARRVMITGIGTSDQHVTQSWEEYINDHVTWTLSGTTDEAEMLDALLAGRVFFGDVTAFAGERPRLDLVVPGRAAMGQILTEVDGPVSVEASLRGVLPDDELVWIVDGEEVGRTPGADGVLSDILEVQPAPWRTVRVELRDRDGNGKLFSNPIALSTDALAVPAARAPRP